VASGFALQVDRERASSPQHQVEFRFDRHSQTGCSRPINADNISTHVSKHHCAVRAGADTGEFNDP
jgi:hypothetical protein